MRGRRRRGPGHAAGRNPDVTQTATPAGAPTGPRGMARHVFLTGPPGVGKTTLIQKASEVLKSSGVPVDGFYTEEVRQGGRRIGFDVVTLSGMRGVLSRIGSEPPPGKRECRVGQYVVDLTSFELLALPVLRNAGSSSGPGQRVCVIDEIGKMELFSQPFIQAVRQTLSTPGTVVLGTIPIPKGKPLALVEEIRNRNDVQVFSYFNLTGSSMLPSGSMDSYSYTSERRSVSLWIQGHQGKQKPPFARYCDVCAKQQQVKMVCVPVSCTSGCAGSHQASSVPCLSRIHAFRLMKPYGLFQRKPDSCFP
ncbi:cancer-related nucleoside-triphosphatase isoform X1 [Canis lupus baileyi]|nr:cancer-related nucleoside-triphosphatase isoform X1 [Canis lupus dingo]XP_038389818.1 cancer-related nucleoside-triphosphatase isoform X1 [Canis lupus familiaris]XP_038518442.1 cancer-related nucleoside-triphosphatase isoform X1 [Canis lupus familiaris]XP_848743.3 cancer-related nucleoside-triphosphatase isoform X1 [Canis lupus familiaris]|eukprot:XP_848743.3 cancer-related nucleoside-triphosphatase isoform X1 [Canis lupus familiaris]